MTTGKESNVDEMHPVAALGIVILMILTADLAWRREKSLAAALIAALGS